MIWMANKEDDEMPPLPPVEGDNAFGANEETNAADGVRVALEALRCRVLKSKKGARGFESV